MAQAPTPTQEQWIPLGTTRGGGPNRVATLSVTLAAYSNQTRCVIHMNNALFDELDIEDATFVGIFGSPDGTRLRLDFAYGDSKPASNYYRFDTNTKQFVAIAMAHALNLKLGDKAQFSGDAFEVSDDGDAIVLTLDKAVILRDAVSKGN